ncbi:hypothetical protein K504DRAFT_335722, partial [Pleomassaria siparia CBS 279.74]
ATTPADPRPITLDVGGRTFRASKATLQDSTWLSNYFERWLPGHTHGDTLFLDHDPDLFAHILRYLRRQEVFPLFWSKDHGFDYDLYNRLEVEAQHLGVHALETWIKEKKYLEAVVVQRSAPVVQSLSSMKEDREDQDKEYERYTVRQKKLVYLCPRDIPVHRGRKEACGLACTKAQQGTPIQYEEEESLDLITVVKTVVFDKSVCRM